LPDHHAGRSARNGDAAALGKQGGYDWDAMARCESGDNWRSNTGNGYFGGLQFSLGTWHAYGGRGMPQLASRDQQIRVAQRVISSRGTAAWPACGAYLYR
jgi:hypothetical protein